MKNVIVRVMTKMVIPDTPKNARNFSFYILLTKVKGNKNRDATRTIKAGLV